jgi:hypothetical protein
MRELRAFGTKGEWKRLFVAMATLELRSDYKSKNYYHFGFGELGMIP